MGKRIQKIRKDSPALADREEVQAITEDIDTYAAIAGFASSEAGTILIKAMDQDVNSSVNALIAGYKTMPELELRGLCAQLDARVQFVRTLKRSRTNLDDAEAVLAETLRSLTT